MSDTETIPTPAEAIAALGLTVDSVFVPFSQSRNAKPGADGKVWRSLNWTVTLKRNGREILTTDYSASEGHCPASKLSVGNTDRKHMIAWELEHGTKAGAVHYAGRDLRVSASWAKRNAILPDPLDVIHSLVSDSDVLDSGGFENWASDLGYDADSRKAEAIYRACLELALKMRASLGDDGLAQLRDAFQDY
jgi:hypothetical protein